MASTPRQALLENRSNMSFKRRFPVASVARTWLAVVLMGLAAAPAAVYAQATPAVSTVVALSGSYVQGNLILGPDGALYGTAYHGSTSVSSYVSGGVVFRSTLDGSSVTTLYQLGIEDGISPQAGLLLGSDGKFYGTTQFGKGTVAKSTGAIFRIAVDGTGFTTLHSFDEYSGLNGNTAPINVQGAFPMAELIEGADGYLYGTTSAGGPNGTGAVYRVSRDGTAFQTLHTFGAIALDTAGKVVTPITTPDGMTPSGPLVLGADGYLYGTAGYGGANARGTIFRLRTDGTGFQLLHTFSASTEENNTGLLKNADGVSPVAGLTDGQDGFFYGVASQGGTNGYGTLFAISPDGGTFTVLHNFDVKLGSQPVAELLLGRDGKLYGVTSGGGSDSSGSQTTYGTIFSIARDGTGFTVLHSMTGKNGYRPASRLVQPSDTVLIGTTGAGGNCSYGTIFRYSSTGDTVTGNTKCGYKKKNPYNSGGGGSVEPALLLLLGGLGLARRRRR
jgi:uncharacterized repeat protein (TIGR03803 family)